MGLGEASFELGEIDEAVRYLRDALKRLESQSGFDLPLAETRYLLARALAKKGTKSAKEVESLVALALPIVTAHNASGNTQGDSRYQQIEGWLRQRI